MVTACGSTARKRGATSASPVTASSTTKSSKIRSSRSPPIPCRRFRSTSIAHPTATCGVSSCRTASCRRATRCASRSWSTTSPTTTPTPTATTHSPSMPRSRPRPGSRNTSWCASACRRGACTAGGEGIRRAYDEAVANFIRGGNNRVILATDGDFNVGASSDAEMVQLIEEKRRTGVFLTVLGVGEGNLQAAKMEKLADKGNGNYAYLDNIAEAQKVLVHELGGTLYTVAKDVKIQVEWNPARVRAYRLIGYENRMLRNEDFADDKKDAGEVGSGHSVTALYEVVPVGVNTDVTIRMPDSLRYQHRDAQSTSAAGAELLFVKVRYKQPDGDQSRLISQPVLAQAGQAPSVDFQFQAAVAEFGLLLRNSDFRGKADLGHVIAAAREARGNDADGYRAEFVRLAETVRGIGLARKDGSH